MSGSKAKNGATGEDASLSVDIVAGGWNAETEAARLRALFATEPTGDRPPLYFLHSLLPHQPYVLTTDGTVYPPVDLPGTVGSTVWPDDERVRLAGWQRLQMQLVATDKLLVDARAELDNGKRREMYVEMQRILRDEGGFVCPVFANQICVTNDKVRVSDKLAANWAVDGLKNYELWSFA